MVKINTGRVWLGAVVGAVVWFIWSAVTNFFVLMPHYTAAQQAKQMLAAPRYSFFMIAWFITLFLLACIGSWLYAGVRATFGAGPKTALLVGCLLGFAAGFPLAFSIASWVPFSRIFPLWWMLELWVGAILATFFAAWIYKD